MKKIMTIFGAIIIASFMLTSCGDGSNESDFMALFSGKVYEMGEGENMVKVSFELENYHQECGDLGQVGWVGSYWADGPLFTVDVNVQEKELTTHNVSDGCTIDSKKTYKIKYINDNTISLTVINCENDFFVVCGPFTLTNKTKTENNNSSNGSEIEVNQKRESESSESQSVDGVYNDHSGDFQSTVRINGNRFSWSSTMYGQQQPTSYGIVVNNDIYDETGSVIIGTIDPQRGTVRLRTACCGIITCSK